MKIVYVSLSIIAIVLVLMTGMPFMFVPGVNNAYARHMPTILNPKQIPIIAATVQTVP